MIYTGTRHCSRVWFTCMNLVRSAEDTVVPANGKALIDTQLSIAVPPGTYGRVAPRSGLGEYGRPSSEILK